MAGLWASAGPQVHQAPLTEDHSAPTSQQFSLRHCLLGEARTKWLRAGWDVESYPSKPRGKAQQSHENLLCLEWVEKNKKPEARSFEEKCSLGLVFKQQQTATKIPTTQLKSGHIRSGKMAVCPLGFKHTEFEEAAFHTLLGHTSGIILALCVSEV